MPAKLALFCALIIGEAKTLYRFHDAQWTYVHIYNVGKVQSFPQQNKVNW